MQLDKQYEKRIGRVGGSMHSENSVIKRQVQQLGVWNQKNSIKKISKLGQSMQFGEKYHNSIGSVADHMQLENGLYIFPWHW